MLILLLFIYTRQPVDFYKDPNEPQYITQSDIGLDGCIGRMGNKTVVTL